MESPQQASLGKGRQSHGTAWDPDQTDQLQKQLLYLRKDAGFTPKRLARAPLIAQLLGGVNEPFGLMRLRLVSAIESLNDEDPDVLLAAFGLTPDTEGIPLLTERRRVYGDRHHIKVEAVADREAVALGDLRRQLVTGWYPNSPSNFRVPVYHNGFIQQSVQIATVVRNRAWQETRESYRLIAAFDEADYISISSSFPGTPTVHGDDFTVRTMRIGASHTHEFVHREPMRRGGTYDLTFTLTPDPEFATPGALKEESRAFHEPTRFVSFRAAFYGPLPKHIWSYRGLSYFERPGSPEVCQPLTIGTNPGVKVDYHDLYGGLYSGIAWEW